MESPKSLQAIWRHNMWINLDKRGLILKLEKFRVL